MDLLIQLRGLLPLQVMKELNLGLQSDTWEAGVKTQHGGLLRVSGEENSALLHVVFFSRLTVRPCFVLAAFVTGLQRAVSGCVTADCNG